MGKVFLVQGLGYGDEGKGSIVDYLVRQEAASLVVRFNGGAQAAHNVVTDDGRHHTFAQFGSGTFAGARTFLSRFMLFNPFTLLPEAKHFSSVGIDLPLSRITVEEGALVTSPFHMATNRIREWLRYENRQGRHGSCGMGIAETVVQNLTHPEEVIHAAEMRDPDVCRKKLETYRARMAGELHNATLTYMKDDAYASSGIAREYGILYGDDLTVDEVAETYANLSRELEIVGPAWLSRKLTEAGTVIFEGAQGVLLDQDYGWAPHNTWSDCTFTNAEDLVDGTPITAKIGVLRGYMTRHGAGPLVTECKTCKPASGEHNSEGPWQERFRLGHFDPIAFRYALEVVGGVDQLALTCLDHLRIGIKSCKEYTTRVGEERERNGLSKSTWDNISVQRPMPEEATDPFHQRQQHRQESMGKLMSFMQPVYETLPDVETFVSHVEKELHTPVKLCSFGPKASDKRPR